MADLNDWSENMTTLSPAQRKKGPGLKPAPAVKTPEISELGG
jgi:hypothetical protein